MFTFERWATAADTFFRSYPSAPTFLAWLEVAEAVVVAVAVLLVQAAEGEDTAVAEATAVATEAAATRQEPATGAALEVEEVVVAMLRTEPVW